MFCKSFRVSPVLFAAFLLVSIPARAATVVFEFSSTCTDLRNTDCAAFGLAAGETVSGGFQLDASLGTPGSILFLDKDAYEFRFTFGDQQFSEADATSALGINIAQDGASFSSIVGNFRNASGAELTLLTVTTVNIALGAAEADTFGGGGAWLLSEDSDLFTSPVPLPAAAWLFAPALGALWLGNRRRPTAVGSAG
ncbi:hypothetical protein E4634_00405 [Mangrovimicrobium sediminis]|uniref:VPLPA-CTERM sorting domain-containing protein n=1 Tax=Mangrovimicrobium sediminis TaxID=2562682 RepID=A0A4Z0M956_9GAMM|nr:hypothetical protein [Haliea sp. SAOS-164]TGD76049.1 hypothetical protein E4634_00405 [Haliea sp. SAOS-164]